MHLALLDIDNDNLIKAKDILRDLDPRLQTEAYVLDVADRVAWKEIAGQIGASFADIDLVVLNAGKGYKPQTADKGRMNAWLDQEYWTKVRRQVSASERRAYTIRPLTRMSLVP